jgi:hypothetical protein
LLVAVGGLSGSGKSTFARAVAPALGASPGAVVLRSDEVRKRLLNIPPTQRVDPDFYTPAWYVRTYDELISSARALLQAGHAVVLDATFIDPELRARAEQLAHDCRVPFHGIWLEAGQEILEARVAARIGDASDATLAVLHDQMQRLARTEIAWPRLDASQDPAAAASGWLGERC